MKFTIDWRFVGIATDTLVARRHAEVGLRRLATTDQVVRDLVLGELKKSGYLDDEDERNIAYQEVHFLEDLIPRLELYGLVLMLWATYESVVKRLPKLVGPWTPNDVTSASGNSFVSKAHRFYKSHLGVTLCVDGAEEDFVRLVADVKNAIGHATGEVDILKVNTRRRLERAASNGAILIEGGVLAPTPDFVQAVATRLDGAASALISRLKETFPPATASDNR